ncbi:MAG TPA: Gfo/Idh/MocA family oxidoreductase, partial [Actinomycetota bacterium]|nr:Gfo/Idh/MocA family oxidoreductase [Actinomycetota bacterium]
MTAPGRLRIALVGTGWIMDFHARAVLEHPGAELVAAANWREPSLRRLADRHGIARTTTDWRALATDPAVDAVVIGTPNALHAPQAIAFLEAGKHVLVEKPMARTRAEADAMVAAAGGAGAWLMVAHCWRFHPDVRALRARVEAGELGEIVRSRGYGVHARWGPSGWFTDPELAGGGAL